MHSERPFAKKSLGCWGTARDPLETSQRSPDLTSAHGPTCLDLRPFGPRASGTCFTISVAWKWPGCLDVHARRCNEYH